jgi:hypothetical protein
MSTGFSRSPRDFLAEYRAGTQSVWTIPTAGGTPTEIRAAHAVANTITVSLDGRLLGFRTLAAEGPSRPVVYRLPACDERREFPTTSRSRVRFTPDGQGLAFLDMRNVWVPLSGVDLASAEPLKRVPLGVAILR